MQYPLSIIRVLPIFVPLICLLFGSVLSADEYLNEAKGVCFKTGRPMSCVKYRLLSYVNNYQLKAFNVTDDSSVKFVAIPNVTVAASDEALFQARQIPSDGEGTKLIKFLQRQIGRILNTQGLMFDLPEEARLYNDGEEVVTGRRKDKKTRQMLVPMLMLLKLFKIKILAAITLVGVIAIKKGLLIGAAIIYHVINSIKNHCKTQYHVVPYHVEDHEHHDAATLNDYGLNAATAYTGGHGKEWERYTRTRRANNYAYPYFAA